MKFCVLENMKMDIKFSVFIGILIQNSAYWMMVEGSIKAFTRTRPPILHSSSEQSTTRSINSTNTFSSSETSENSTRPRTITGSSKSPKINVSYLHGEQLFPDGYNKYEIPTHHFNVPIYVQVSIFIRKILNIDEKNEEILIDTDFALKWIDWKLYEHLVKLHIKDKEKVRKNLTMDSEVLKEIWKPDVYIDEMATVQKTSILSEPVTLKFLQDLHRGDIVYSSRSTFRLRCAMNFMYYPADTQTCVYHLRSYSYYDYQLRFFWAKSAGVFLNTPSDANFDVQVESIKPLKNHRYEFYLEDNFNTFRAGEYSALEFTIKVRRKLSYHLVQTYLPSVLLVLITWICFLLPSDMVEARIGISMTTVLTLTAMFDSVREQSPVVSYTMAIDVWMVFNIIFVFLALLIFALIYWFKLRLKKFDEMLKNKESLLKSSVIDSDDDEDHIEIEIMAKRQQKYFSRIVNLMKKYAFYTFALIFVIFCIAYWSWLLSCSGYLQWDLNPMYNAVTNLTGVNTKDPLYSYHLVSYSGEEVMPGQEEVSNEDSSSQGLESFENIDSVLNGTNNTASEKFG